LPFAFSELRSTRFAFFLSSQYLAFASSALPINIEPELFTSLANCVPSQFSQVLSSELLLLFVPPQPQDWQHGAFLFKLVALVFP